MDLHQLNAIPMWVVYLGAAFTMVALLVASYQNRWSCRVFFLLALRLAIGWHFLFEGMHKVHTVYVGPTETNRVFTSEPYFGAADGPLGPMMRKQFGDVDEQLRAKLTPKDLPKSFADRTADERMRRNLDGKPMFLDTAKDEDFVKFVPDAVANDWKKFVEDFSGRYHLTDAEKKKLDGQIDDEERKQIEERDRLGDELSELTRKDSGLASREFELTNPPAGFVNPKAADELKQVQDERKKLAAERNEKVKLITKLDDAGVGDYTVAALSQYGRWVAGVEGRASKVKYVSNDVDLSAPQRLDYIAARQKDLDALKKRAEAELGVGYGHEQNRMKDLKALVTQAKGVLVADADAFVMELKKGVYTGVMAVRLVEKAPPPSKAVEKEPGKVDPAKLAAFLPPSADTADATFDKLPTALQDTFNAYHAAFKTEVPDAASPAVDHAYDLAKDRAANWYAGRDEFIGKKVGKGKGKYAEAVEKYQALANNPKAAAKDLADAQTAVVNELDARYASLKQTLTSALPADVADWPTPGKPDKGKGPLLDKVTMWMLVAVGGMLLAGLFTRVACVVGAIFLLMTYLAHPPFPWLPLPPMTEGNPLFINKNVIEMLGLLVIVTFPTGRWMGIDALIHKVVFWKADEPK